MTVFMFVGQGIDLPWVSPEVLETREVSELLATASECCSVDIPKLLVRGGRELERSEVLQPAMVAVCLGLHRLLEIAGVLPRIVLGHSLGELSAWAAAGGITSHQAVKVAALRGRLMDREAARNPGGMLRIIGDRALCDDAIALGNRAGWMSLGAHNGPGECAVSGDHAALKAVAAEFPSSRLQVSGAWHSQAMAGAHDELRAELRALPSAVLRAEFVSNQRGQVADGQAIPDLLAGQLCHPIQWASAMHTLDERKVRRYVAVGPGKTLQALVHRNLGVDTRVEIIDSLKAVAAAAA